MLKDTLKKLLQAKTSKKEETKVIHQGKLDEKLKGQMIDKMMKGKK